MSKKVAINGFGRIGRLTFRHLIQNPDVEVVAINDLTDNATLAHLLKYDSTQGVFNGTVAHTEDSLIVNGKVIKAFAERNPAALPWGELEVDVVLECTGLFVKREKVAMHLEAGAKKAVISAPAKGGGVKTIVLGVNTEAITDEDTIYSNASCTTNCLAPMMKVIMDNWGIVNGTMTTTHAYTGDQRILDAPHSDLRRARAAAINIVPTSTGAAIAVREVLPSVAGRTILAMAVRVPVPTGSMTDLTVTLEKPTTKEELLAKFKEAAEGPMKGILEYSTDPLVSSDVIGNPHSCVFDSLLADVNGTLAKVVGWYDNEAGYSARLAELTAMV